MAKPEDKALIAVPREVPLTTLIQHSVDAEGPLDDILQEGMGRGLEALVNLSTAPLFREDPVSYPVTTGIGQKLTRVGRLASGIYNKLHKLIDDQSSHGPAKGSRVVVRQSGFHPDADRTGKRR